MSHLIFNKESIYNINFKSLGEYKGRINGIINKKKEQLEKE